MSASEGARGWRLFRRSRRDADDRPPGDTRCRNCGADAPGAYCPSCGQETRLMLPRATQFMREAAGRYVAFDGKMWRTLFLLLFRPGFLTREYLAGRRVRYVRPARLVLVLAIVLFAAIRLTNDDESIVLSAGSDPPPPAAPATGGAPPRTAPDKAAPAPASPPKAPGKSLIELDGEPLKIGAGPARIEIDDDLDISVAGIESAWGQRVAKRFTSFNRLERGEKVRAIVAGMIRFGPYALIALLPAFAMLMQLLYLGRGKRYPNRPRRYAEHLVYGAHSHAFVALLGTLAAVVATGPLTALLALWGAVYLPWSMHAVYGGRWVGVFVRAFVASIAYAVLFALAVAGLVVVAVLLR
jgi:hypothetical protein